ncbi:MAG: SURF1 family protein [Gammaproteobacteria bacterium]
MGKIFFGAVILALLFTHAGSWQLDRARQKQNLAAAMEERARLPPLRVSGAINKDEALRYRKVVAAGEFAPHGQILIDNQVQAGRAGYHVITPLRIEGSDAVVLVNRGWIELGSDRNVLPELPLPEGRIEIRGVLDTPPGAPPITWGEEARPGSHWGKRWAYLDLDYYAESTRYAVLPLIILLDSAAPYGLVRDWPKFDAKVHMHRGYAIVWFSFAVITLAGCVAILFVGQAGASDPQ